MRALIVDDEPVARKVLREELEVVPGIDVVGEAGNGIAAIEQNRLLKPDLMFLDLQMPGMDGFQVIREMNSGSMPAVIIVTAFDQHAIQAFDEGAVDYLLKPVSSERLALAIDRARRIIGKPKELAQQIAHLQEVGQPNRGPAPRKIVGRLGEEYFLLAPAEVLAFQADGDLVWIITRKQRYLATLPLRALQEKLAGLPFQRVHRNALVNVTHIRKMAALSSQRWLLTLHNDQEFVVSKRQARAVREILSW